MDFLKRCYEKILLLAVLVGLIGSTGYLIWKTMEGLQGPGGALPMPPKPSVQPLDMAMYNNILQRLEKPSMWEAEANQLFQTAPPKVVEPVVPPRMDETNKPPPTVVLPVYMERVAFERFELLFMAYSFDEETQKAHTFQVNYANREKSFFVRAVGDLIMDPFAKENTQYRIVGFERRLVNAGLVPEDRSLLTVQAPGEDPLVIQLSKPSWTREPVAWVGCQFPPDKKGGPPERAGRTQRVRRGDSITCGTNTYNVVDIKTNEMIIVYPTESTTNTFTIPLDQGQSPRVE